MHKQAQGQRLNSLSLHNFQKTFVIATNQVVDCMLTRHDMDWWVALTGLWHGDNVAECCTSRGWWLDFMWFWLVCNVAPCRRWRRAEVTDWWCKSNSLKWIWVGPNKWACMSRPQCMCEACIERITEKITPSINYLHRDATSTKYHQLITCIEMRHPQKSKVSNK